MAETLHWSELDHLAVKTAKALAADAVEKAGNGHPGTAISLAPAMHLLYQHVLRHDPKDPAWPGRDRFVLSIGHASLLQYVQLYLGGFGLELEDLQNLRKWGSKTPGHPEYGHTQAVEITTGPLGQGLASAVGFAYAARYERGLFDPQAAAGASPFDHFIYTLVGDGDMQEGVTAEASSLAGHQQLGNLIAIYDANQISIEDDVNIAFSEDVAARYMSYGWQVLRVSWRKNGQYFEDVHALHDAIAKAKQESCQPSLIILDTIIGWPSPTKQNTGAIHGAKLGTEEVRGLKKALELEEDETFQVPGAVLAHTRNLRERQRETREAWERQMQNWRQREPERAKTFDRLYTDFAGASANAGTQQNNIRLTAEQVDQIWQALPLFTPGTPVATRAASGKTLAALAPLLPELWGGSADLAGSNNTTLPDCKSFAPTAHSTETWQAEPFGRVLHFGIREHAMAAIVNGIALHGPTRPYCGTFLMFSDYMRPAVRLAALMGTPSIFVWTHDSVGVGEDGPTHQPIEQLASLRAIPNLSVVRPADAAETAVCWLEILRRGDGPAGLVLSRQNLAVPERERVESYARAIADAASQASDSARAGGTTDSRSGNPLVACASNAWRGAYVYSETSTGKLDVIIIATGSEVEVAARAREELLLEGIGARIVSAPCLEWFAEQDESYRSKVLPSSCSARVSVEAGLALGWRELVGDNGECVSIEHFGASAPGDELFTRFGVTAQAVCEAAKRSIARVR